MLEHPHHIYREVLLENIKSGKVNVWVDAGGGSDPGLQTKHYDYLKNIEIISCDKNKKTLRKNKYANRTISCNLKNIPLNDNFADIVTLRMVVEHLEDPINVLKSLSRILKKRGKLIIYTPNAINYVSLISRLFPESYKGRIRKKWWGIGDVGYTYYKANTRKRLRSILRELGFEEKYFYYLPFPILPYSHKLHFIESSFASLLSFFKIFDASILGIYQKIN